MDITLGLGARMLGRTAPNPSVGCILVKDGVVIARAATASGGRPHAETQALAIAGETAKGATAYVSLEPCAHDGPNGSCAMALIAAGIKRAVIALEDPDPRTSGKGLAILKAAGIETLSGVLAEKAAQLHEGFIRRIKEGRPVFTLKLAATLDGRIATASGESQWITGEMARAYVHRLRASHDAIMVGIGTVLSDDPELTCRLPGLEDASPARIVFDSKLQIPLSAKLVWQAANVPTWMVTGENHNAATAVNLKKSGIKILPVPEGKDGKLDLIAAAKKLGDLGFTRVLCEGGAYLAASLIKANLADRLEWITAPDLLGNDGRCALHSLGIENLAQMPCFKPVSSRALGQDRLESLARAG